MTQVLEQIILQKDVLTSFVSFLSSADRLRISLLLSKDLIKLFTSHPFDVAVKVVDMHHDCQYLGLGICWVRENDSLHETLFPRSRLEAVDIDDEPHRAWADYQLLAPAEVAKQTGEDASHGEEMVRIVERNVHPERPVWWGQRPRPHILRDLKDAQGINDAPDCSSSEDEESELGDGPVETPSRQGSHKYGATRIYMQADGPVPTYKAPKHWAPSFKEIWAEVHQELPFRICRLSIVFPQCPDASLLEWLPDLQFNQTLSISRHWHYGEVAIDKRFCTKNLRSLSVKNLCFDEGDVNTTEFLRRASFQEVCIQMNEVPGEWIKHTWLGDGSESLAMLRRCSRLHLHVHNLRCDSITLADCARSLSKVLVSLEVGTLGDMFLSPMLRSSCLAFPKLRSLSLRGFSFEEWPTYVNGFTPEEAEQVFPCLESAELPSCFFDHTQILSICSNLQISFLPACLRSLRIIDPLGATSARDLRTFASCLQHISSRCPHLSKISAGFRNVSALTDVSASEYFSTDCREDFLAAASDPRWHGLSSLTCAEITLAPSLDLSDPVMRFSAMFQTLTEDDQEASREAHALQLASHLQLRLEFIQTLEKTLNAVWKRHPNTLHSWLEAYNTVIVEGPEQRVP
mmetsp:Transcript_118216/g.215004  ORF Transcript_118216/g.215004 Transcript_118216/m.215004 type:complete len:630 (+) Transcript_118216:160-2049(+)